MAEEAILRVHPVLHFPIGIQFEVTDTYNGHQRGTWYYRTPFPGHVLRGPYHSYEAASYFLSKEDDGS